MSAGRICSRSTYLADPEESVQVAADRMKDENVGTLVVLDADRKPVGILTDRDLAVRVVAAGLDARKAKVAQVMSAHPRQVSEETPIEDAVATMRGLGVRRLPVVDAAGRLAGILSVDDVLELLVEELSNLGRIAAASRAGAGVAATRTAGGPKRSAGPSGLQRSASDLEC